MKISINEPCHENWDAMTPNAQGAFCKSCAKDVVDFSKMGISEIKSFFSNPQGGKVCGRFEEKQLQELTFDDFFSKFTYWNFTKKFAVIFFMAFGFWIFSNAGAMAQSNHHMKGEVMYVPEKTIKKDTAKKQQPTQCDKKMIMGKMKARNDVKQEPVKPEQMMMGMIAIRPQVQKVVEPVAIDTTKKEESVIESTIEQIKKPEHVIKGNAIVTNDIVGVTNTNNIIKGDVICAIDKTVEHKEPVKPITIIPFSEVLKKDSVVADVSRIKDNTIQTIMYPNPSNGNFLIETNILTKQTVNVLDENGRLVLTQNITGTSSIDGSSLKAGVYNVIIKDNSSGETIKKRIVIVK